MTFDSMKRNIERLCAEWPELTAIVSKVSDELVAALDDMSAWQASDPRAQNPQTAMGQYGSQVANALLQAQATIQSMTAQAAMADAQQKRNEKRIQVAAPPPVALIKRPNGAAD